MYFLSSTSVQLQHQNQYCSVYYKRVYFDNTMFWTMHSDSFFVLGCILCSLHSFLLCVSKAMYIWYRFSDKQIYLSTE